MPLTHIMLSSAGSRPSPPSPAAYVWRLEPPVRRPFPAPFRGERSSLANITSIGPRFATRLQEEIHPVRADGRLVGSNRAMSGKGVSKRARAHSEVGREQAKQGQQQKFIARGFSSSSSAAGGIPSRPPSRACIISPRTPHACSNLYGNHWTRRRIGTPEDKAPLTRRFGSRWCGRPGCAGARRFATCSIQY